MRANITANGLLKIIPETSLEQYALGRWMEECEREEGKWNKICISSEESK